MYGRNVYEVAPTGPVGDDPNDRWSVRSARPMRVVRRVPDGTVQKAARQASGAKPRPSRSNGGHSWLGAAFNGGSAKSAKPKTGGGYSWKGPAFK